MKTCTRCHTEKLRSDFNRQSRVRDGLQPWCRACSKDWYAENSQRHQANVRVNTKRYAAEVYAFIVSYLQAHPCVDCGEADIVVLDFDHVRGKKLLSIGMMIHNHRSLASVKAEIEKCEVRCANCHRRVTAHRNGRWRRRLLTA